MIGSPDLKWLGLAWFGGGGLGLGGGNLQTGIATKQSLLLERLYCYTGFAIRQGVPGGPWVIGSPDLEWLGLAWFGGGGLGLGGARLVTSSSSSPSSTSMYHSNKNSTTLTPKNKNVTHTNYKTKTTQNQPKTPEIPASNKKRQSPRFQNAKKQCHKKRDLAQNHPKPGQNSRNNSVQQDMSCEHNKNTKKAHPPATSKHSSKLEK